jgi:hypothetical protein
MPFLLLRAPAHYTSVAARAGRVRAANRRCLGSGYAMCRILNFCAFNDVSDRESRKAARISNSGIADYFFTLPAASNCLT